MVELSYAPWETSMLLLALFACKIDNNFENKDDGNGPDWETAEPDCPPQIPDCNETDEPIDTEDSAEIVEPNYCEPPYVAGNALSKVDECIVEEQTGGFNPTVEWSKNTWSVEASSNNIMMMPAVASLTDDNGDGQIDEDDTPDVIVVTYGGTGTLRAVSGKDGSEIFNVTNQGLQGQGAVAAGDIDGDGIVEIIACTSNTVKAFEHDGTLKWTSVNVGGQIQGTSDAPAISDMDGDGDPEIIVGRAILDNDGNKLGFGTLGMGTTQNVGTTSFAVDLDGDGDEEVITGNAAYNRDGSTKYSNSHGDGYVAVGDMDNDGMPNIVVTGDAKMRILDEEYNLICNATIPGANASAGGPPTIADFDGDGEPEIGVAATSTYTVFENDCSQLWQRTTQDASSGNTGSAVFDFEGDGIAEVVYSDETRIWVFAGPDGTVKLENTQHTNATWTEYSVIADIDGDGHAEIVVPNTGSITGITVVGDADDSWMEGRRIWNQHAYHITNVEDDGTIPKKADINWDTYNNFRSGDLIAATGGEWPDLVATIDDVCETECDRGRIFITARAGNQGHADVTDPVELVIYAVTPDGDKRLTSKTITSGLPAGEMQAGVTLEVSGLDSWTIYDLYAVVDVVDDINECDETNNTSGTWGGAVCLQ